MLKKINKQYINNNVTVVVRTVGERTTEFCYQLIAKQIAKENIFLVNKTPFTEAIRETFKIGIREKRKWTLVVDADVLLKNDSIINLVSYAENIDSKKLFEVEGKIIDKFISNINPREAGNHLYKTNILNEAINYIPKSMNEIRPESYVKKQMDSIGYYWLVSPILLGIHDFEQYYIDIYRKCFVQAIKHKDHVNSLLESWQIKSKTDTDYKIALAAYNDANNWNENIEINKNASFVNDKTLFNLEVNEKKTTK